MARRDNKLGENKATFITALKQFTEYNALGAALDDKLHDRLVCGTGDGKIQHHLRYRISF